MKSLNIKYEKIFLSSWKPYIWLCILTLAVYFQTFWYSFSPMDDTWLIVQKLDSLKDISNLPSYFLNSTLGRAVGYYRPLLMITFMFDTLIGGGSPFVYHLSNVIFHMASVLLVFRLFTKTGINTLLSFVFAMIFAVHPANVLAVAWIPGRNDVILSLFVFASAITCINYFREHKIYWFILHLFCLICALLTKESAIVLPFILYIYYLLLHENHKRTEKIIFPIIWITVLAGWYLLRFYVVSGNVHLAQPNATQTIIKTISSMTIFFGRFFVPFELNGHWPLITGTLVLVIIVILILSKSISSRMTLWGALWFMMFLLVPVVFKGGVYNHWLYPASFGAFILIAQVKPFKINKIVQFGILFLVLGIFITKTLVESKIYKDELTYANNYVNRSSDYIMSYFSRGIAYLKKNQYNEAIRDFDRVLAVRTDFVNAYYNRGVAYNLLKKYDLAINDFNKTVELSPNFVYAYLQRGNTYYLIGNYTLAVQDYSMYLRYNSPDPIVFLNRARAYYQLFQYNNAIQDLNHYIKIKPNDSNGYYVLGIVYYDIQDLNKSYKLLLKALHMGYSVPPKLLEELKAKLNL